MEKPSPLAAPSPRLGAGCVCVCVLGARVPCVGLGGCLLCLLVSPCRLQTVVVVSGGVLYVQYDAVHPSHDYCLGPARSSTPCSPRLTRKTILQWTIKGGIPCDSAAGGPGGGPDGCRGTNGRRFREAAWSWCVPRVKPVSLCAPGPVAGLPP